MKGTNANFPRKAMSMPMVLKSIVGNIACHSSSTTPANSLLVTLDVSSIHSNIPQNEDINGCEHYFLS